MKLLTHSLTHSIKSALLYAFPPGSRDLTPLIFNTYYIINSLCVSCGMRITLSHRFEEAHEVMSRDVLPHIAHPLTCQIFNAVQCAFEDLVVVINDRRPVTVNHRVYCHTSPRLH